MSPLPFGTFAAVALLAALTGCTAGAHASLRQPAPSPVSTTAPSPTPSRPSLQVPAGASLVATATTRSIVVRRAPEAGSAVRWRLSNPNNLGAPLVFSVVGELPGWWQVLVPARPNQSVGWVEAGTVRIEIDPYSITATLHRHEATVYRYGHVLWRLRIGVGARSAPTPTGRFYLTELLRAAQPHGAYGPFAYGTSAFSNVYSEFEGGNGQIGVHGTDDPSSIGASVSHGCIRLHNADITRLASTVPAGTPLTVVA